MSTDSYTNRTFALVAKKHLRSLAISLLDDPHGISEESYHKLIDILVSHGIGEDLVANIEELKGRLFLPEGHNIKP